MANFWIWLAGKKTYCLAGIVLGVASYLLAAGELTPANALAVLLFAAGGLSATFRSALGKHQAEELALLTQIAAGGAALAAKNLPAALKAGESAATAGIALVQEIKSDAAIAAVAATQPAEGK